ncbi:MAG: Gfo/Idh/MocA family oxidoreductase [Alphaproteobacteria bacterium]|nr:Gfo/Idh/MocA family oxidoreductase [Alphaproteobacteria bacterium]
MPTRKVRYGVVGLGFISQAAMLPAFANARHNSELVALVSGAPRKLRALGRRYRAPFVASYDEYDVLLASGAVDAVYIGLPNTLHCDYAVRALAAGIHVLCDKPLAASQAECRRMIERAETAGTKLMTAYRLHFEPGNLETYDLIHHGRLGDLRFFTSQFAQQVRAGNIRTRADLAGGPLYDLGIYCINAARHVFRTEPIHIQATATRGRDTRSAEVEETVQVSMRFPRDRLASFTCSFGAADVSSYQVFGAKGRLRLDQAYDMRGEKRLSVEVATRNGRRQKTIPAHDQFAPLLSHFSDCILNDGEPVSSAADGLADIRVVEAIGAALADGGQVDLEPMEFQGSLLKSRNAARLRPPRKANLVGARPPSA